MRNKIFIIFGFILFIFCFIVFYKGLQKPNVYSPELNQKKSISSFVSSDFYSNEKVLSDDIFKKGNYYLVNIWSSWCVPCRLEHPFLIRLKNSKINLVGINYKDNINNAKAFLNELGNPYSKILSDKDGVTSIELGAYGVPETFLINKEKVIIKKIIGPINNESYKEIVNLIK